MKLYVFIAAILVVATFSARADDHNKDCEAFISGQSLIEESLRTPVAEVADKYFKMVDLAPRLLNCESEFNGTPLISALSSPMYLKIRTANYLLDKGADLYVLNNGETQNVTSVLANTISSYGELFGEKNTNRNYLEYHSPYNVFQTSTEAPLRHLILRMMKDYDYSRIQNDQKVINYLSDYYQIGWLKIMLNKWCQSYSV